MGVECCKIVSTLEGMPEGIVSVSMNVETEAQKVESEIIVGPTIGTVSIVAYAAPKLHEGCNARAGVSIPWIRKYDCVENVVYFIFAGEGKSYSVGPVEDYININQAVGSPSKYLSASASSGPASLYTEDEQTNGYGLSYTGLPVSFTTDKNGVVFNNLIPGLPELYLQNFTFEAQSGNLPTANFSFVYFVGNE